VELVSAVVERAEETESTVNAFAVRRFDEALAAAQTAAARYVAGTARALEGVPVAVKLDVAIEGDPASGGCAAFDGAIAAHTDAIPQRILDAGGIIHARSSTPEFSSASFTHTNVWGVTRNPWNPDYSPGGSSGGSAAALAAGSATLATGSDNAGSIRMPASYCGVVGYKPPRGRVPYPAPLNRDPYLSAGPLARTVEDCALFLAVMAGPELADPMALPHLPVPAPPFGGIDHVRVAYTPDLGGFPVAREIQVATATAVQRLTDLAAMVEQVEIEWDWREVLAVGRAHLEHLVGAMAARVVTDFPDDVMPYLKAFAEGITPLERDSVLRTVEGEQRAWEVLQQVFTTFDVLICPTQGLLGFEAGEDYVSRMPMIDGEPVRYPFETHMGLPFNLTNTCPVISVPTGFASNGVPMGAQVVGRPYDEHTVFAIAAALEKAQPDWPFGVAATRRPLSGA
jgi:Asp-tRNA(Asn)/Glu-tRNA(Gln) amidotransferase A subunit family amidase